MPSNHAAWLPSAQTHPFEINSSPIGKPGKNQILIKNHALAIQPIDGLLQRFAFLPLTYPAILGVDVAGEVIEVGHGAPRFKQGDRVIGTAGGMLKGKPEEGGFQEYTVLNENVASLIPGDVEFERAVVLPCGLSCAASAFFREEPFLGLRIPTVPSTKSTGETILVWGGSSSVGSNAIQLAVAAGYEVVTTASAKNFEYVKKLGAKDIFDYNASTAVEEVAKALQGRKVVGALDCIGGEATDMTAKAMKNVDGGRKVITTKPPRDGIIEGLGAHFVDGADFADFPVAEQIYGGFLLEALRAKSFVPAPQPLIVGKGLEKVQEAVDLVMKGMSASKAVVML